MKTIDEMIEILQGFKSGRKVEGRYPAGWCHINSLYSLLAGLNNGTEIRLAPEPKLVPYGPEDGAWLVADARKN